MIRQVTTIDGELAIKIRPEDKIYYNDIVIVTKVTSNKLIKKEVLK